MLPVHKILCPTDFSEPSGRGVDAAVELAEHFSAELTLLSVVTPLQPITPPGVPAGYQVQHYYERMRDAAKSSLEGLAAEKVSKDIRLKNNGTG